MDGDGAFVVEKICSSYDSMAAEEIRFRYALVMEISDFLEAYDAFGGGGDL